MKQVLLAFFLAAAASSPLAAQDVDVGYPPPRSPFRDLEYKQEAAVFAGYYLAGKDPAGVAPRSAPMIGIRYEVGVGGPAQIVARISHVMSDRRVINPVEPASARDLGIQSWPVYIADFGMSINLTGQRSWHGVVPVVYSGIGLASDVGKKAEDDPYKLGTTFAFSFAGGLRIVPGGRFQMRADVGTWFYQIKYPTEYYNLTSDNTAVLENDQATKFWKRNLGITLGGSYLLFR